MSLVHVEPLNIGVAEGTQHPNTRHSENYLLAQPIFRVSAIEAGS